MTQSGHVLIVDDKEAHAQPLADVLRREGFEASTALSAEEAERRTCQEPFDVLVMDLRLNGEIDGLDALGAIRRRVPGISSLLITGYGGEETKARARRCGVDAYLEKPFEVDVFLEIVRLLAERRGFPGDCGDSPRRSRFPLDDVKTAALFAVLEEMPVGVVLVNDACEILYRNNLACRLVVAERDWSRNKDQPVLSSVLRELVVQAQQGREILPSRRMPLVCQDNLSMNFSVSLMRLDGILAAGQRLSALIFERPQCQGQENLLHCETARLWLQILFSDETRKDTRARRKPMLFPPTCPTKNVRCV